MSILNVLGLLLGLASAAQPEEPGSPHPLVVAAERLHRLELGDACDALIRHALEDQGLTDADRARLRLVASSRTLERGDARSAPPEVAIALPARSVLIERTRRDRIAALNRLPTVTALLGAADALYEQGQFDGVQALLEMVMERAPLSAPEHVQLRLRQGLLTMPREAEARSAFWEALLVDRGARLPAYAEPKTVRLFEAVRKTIPPPLPPSAMLQPAPRERDSWDLGLITGGSGLTLLAGGAAAGLVELFAYKGMEDAARANDVGAYDRWLGTAKGAELAANGLVGVGLITLGVGASLYLGSKRGIQISVGARPAAGALTVEGGF
jgi:hypothetical protein